MSKKIIIGLCLLLLSLLITTVPTEAGERKEKTVDNVTAVFEDGILRISGTGEISSSFWSFIAGLNEDTTAIIIDEGITKICDSAFYFFYNLEMVELPDSLVEIGRQAFYYCEKLSTINLPDGIKVIPEGAFGSCTSLSSIKLPSQLTTIEEAAFIFCTSLESIDIPEGVTNIPDSAFYNCSNLKNIKLSSNITNIGKAAFHLCSSLQSIDLPEKLIYIGNEAFSYCSSLSKIELPSQVKSIGNETFYMATGLKYILLPDSIEEIGSYAFSGCKFQSIVFPKYAKLGANLFSSTRDFIGIAIPDSVTEIDSTVFNNLIYSNVTIYANEGSLAAKYASNLGLKLEPFENIFPNDIRFEYDEINLIAGMSFTLNAKSNEKLPIPLTNFTSSDVSVATVQDGVVTVHNGGTAVITAEFAYDRNINVQCIVNSLRPESVKFEINPRTIKLLTGRYSKVNVTAKAKNILGEIPLNWSSSNTEVATIENGVIEVHKAGIATIRASYAYNSSLFVECKIIGYDSYPNFTTPYTEANNFQRESKIYQKTFQTAGKVYKTNFDLTHYATVLPFISQFTDNNGNYVVAYDPDDYDDAFIHIVKFDSNLNIISNIQISKRYPILGAVKCDAEGNYYIVWGNNDINEVENLVVTICVSKYNKDGVYISSAEYTGYETSSYSYDSGTQRPFEAANCDLQIYDDFLICYFGREMYNGHQSSTAIFVNIDTMEKLKQDLPYQSHSFDQQVMKTSTGEYIYVGHGDAFNRGFDIEFTDQNLDIKKSFTIFHFREGSNRDYGYNETYAQLGGIGEVSTGYVLVGASEKTLSYDVAPTNIDYLGHSEARNLFIQIFDKNVSNYGEPNLQLLQEEPRVAVGSRPSYALTRLYLEDGAIDYGVRWLTDYSDKYCVQNPRLITTADDRIVILWEKAQYVDRGSRYISSYYMVLSSIGDVLQEPREFNGRLTAFEQPVVIGDYIYWTVSDGDNSSMTNYRLNIGIEKQVISTLERSLFDADYYASMNPDVAASIGYDEEALLQHWLRHGIKEGRIASRVFYTGYYLEANKDLADIYGTDYEAAYKHFVMYGCNELRPSSSSYSGADYMDLNQDLQYLSGEELIIHYVNYGFSEGRSARKPQSSHPSEGELNGLAKYIFDAAYYASMYPDVAAALGTDAKDLYVHWFNYGIYEGRRASQVFDAAYYLGMNSDLAQLYGSDYQAAFKHFIEYGCNELRPSSDTYYANIYRNNYSDLVNMTGEELIIHYVTNGLLEGRNAISDISNEHNKPDLSRVFHATYYADHNPDVKAAFGYNYSELYNHYVDYGFIEGRSASPIFNVNYYLQYNNDLQNIFGSDYIAAYNHFIQYGMQEGRVASPEFDVSSYITRYQDLYEMYGNNLTLYYDHFVKYGYNEGRIAVW